MYNKIIIKPLLIFCLFLFAKITFALPNPASTYCVKNNHQLILMDNTGFCIFSDNSYCEEWSFFRKKCAQGKYFLPEISTEHAQQMEYCVKKVVGQDTLIKLCNNKN